MRILLAAILVLALTSCGGAKRESGSGGDEKFARVYAQLVLASSDTQAPSPADPEQILKDAGMTKEEFRKVVAEFNRDPQRWGAFIEKVQKVVDEGVALRGAASSDSGHGSSGADHGSSDSDRPPTDPSRAPSDSGRTL